MANPWLGMLNQEGHPIRELAMAFVQPQAPDGHGNHREQDPFGPAGFRAPGGFGWSPLDGPQEHGSWHHDFPHRPHPGRRGGRHDHRGRRHHYESQDELESPHVADTDMPEASDHGDATGEAVMTPATEDTITLEDNEAHAAREVPDPEISTPRDENDQREITSGSDTESQHHGGENACRRCRHRGGSRSRRNNRHNGHEHGSGRGGWGGRGGRGGMHSHHHPFGGPRHPGMFPGGGHPRHGHRGRGGRWPGPPPPAFGGPGQWQNLWTNWAQAAGRGERQRGFQEFLQHILNDVGAMINPDTSGQNATNSSRAAGNANEPTSEAVTGSNATANHSDLDFRPTADIYDMPEEYVVHLILPGAKKEDVSLGWDADACELQVAGVIARDGDEHILQALALAEREVGVFERRVKLGLDKVEAEGIAARMENGILIVNVPKKKEEEQWTEVRKVDIL